jgi:hypothetical protein
VGDTVVVVKVSVVLEVVAVVVEVVEVLGAVVVVAMPQSTFHCQSHVEMSVLK